MFRLRIEKLKEKLSPEFMNEFNQNSIQFYKKFRNRIDGTRCQYYRFTLKQDLLDKGDVDIVDEIHAELFLIIHEIRRLMNAMVYEEMMHPDCREEISRHLMNIYQPVTKRNIGRWKIEERDIYEVIKEEEVLAASKSSA